MKRAFLASIVAGLLAVSPARAFDSPIVAGQMPALTGDCTTTLGAVALTCTKINGVDQNSAWSAYTPSLACGSGSLTSASATGRQKILGKTVFWEATVTITTNGTCAANLQVGLPTAAAGFVYTGIGVETALTSKTVSCNIGAGGSVCIMRFYDGTYPGASGNVITVTGVYEVP